MAPTDDYVDNSRYEPLSKISKGSYGVVYKARDKESGEIVAMKVMLGRRELPHSHTLTEINIHKSLPRHPSVVGFKRAATDRHGRVSVVMEYVENDLRSLIYNERRTLIPLHQIKDVMKQLLSGAAFLHANGVVHRDIKPSNLLVTDKGDLKICDFGLSTRGSCNRGRVGTLRYKAPELFAERQTNASTSALDMWGVGCVMAELVLGQPMFPGKTKGQQVALIHASAACKQQQLRVKLMAARSPALSASGIDLLSRLLAYEPELRITAKDALNHPWFKEDRCALHIIGDLYEWCTNKLHLHTSKLNCGSSISLLAC